MALADHLNEGDIAKLSRIRTAERRASADHRTGDFKSVHAGDGIEFFEHKRYAPGMDVRAIDWRRYARTDELHVKRYEREESRSMAVILDVSASLGKKTVAGPAKSSAAAKLALGAAYIAVNNGLPVSFMAIADTVRDTVHASAHFSQLAAIADIIDGTPFSARSSAASFAALIPPACPVRSDAYIISDFLFMDNDALAPLFTSLHARRVRFRLLQVLSREETDLPFTGDMMLIDAETKASCMIAPALMRGTYARALADLTNALTEAAASHGGRYRLCRTGGALIDDLIAVV
ncbi:MAG: DUF58 domain-containing protein [Spirochaetota bacterium]